ncbi:MAG: copper chaperone PCu(A)C [Nevskiales bacterium]|nr:copper chaperone PCu(A)C [Nevskiales bacterium]
MRIIALLTLLSPVVQACPGLTAEDAWIREAPPGTSVMVGYAQLENTGKNPLNLDTVSSPDFGSVELHRTVIENGVSQMRRHPTVSLPPGGRAVLMPGGLHFMLFRPLRSLKAGDTARIVLYCGTQSRTFSFSVKAITP